MHYGAAIVLYDRAEYPMEQGKLTNGRMQRRNRRGDTENFSLRNHPFYLFNQIFLVRGREINRGLARFNVDYQRWRVLVVLNEFPDCTMQFLAETAGVDRTTLTHTVRLMIGEGLITRVERASDRRSVQLSLTNNGRRRLRSIFPEMIAINKRCFAGFSDAELSHFMDQLRRIFKNLRNGRDLPSLAEFAPEVAPEEQARQFQHASVSIKRKT